MNLTLPIRTRLTIWFFLAFSVATFVMTAASLWMVHQGLQSLEDRELHERVIGVKKFLAVRPPNEPLASLRSALRVDKVTHGDKWLQIIDEHGHWLYRSVHIADLYPSLILPQQLGNRREHFDFISGTRKVRALIRTIHVKGQAYTVQTGMTLNRRIAVLLNFRLHMLILTPILLLMAAIAGYIASRNALGPVVAITKEADRINSHNLDTRLPVPETQDEISEMSLTLNRMLDRVHAGYRSMKEFTANAAHELRTPLSLIRAEADVVLAFDRNPEEYKRALLQIEAESIRMGGLIDDLLALARADAGIQRLTLIPQDASIILHRAAKRWSVTTHQNNLKLTIKSDTGCNIAADQLTIERLLDILIENALHYTPPGGHIELSASREKDVVVISVTDSGLGIAPEHQQRIFQRFYRVSTANDGSLAAQGSGLGLSLARWIAEIHGAQLGVHSVLGKGSCFSLRIAAAADAPSHQQEMENRPELTAKS